MGKQGTSNLCFAGLGEHERVAGEILRVIEWHDTLYQVVNSISRRHGARAGHQLGY